jgi:solute carrier family 25 carnitine/acylcarnitine transporter 20/29
MGRSWEDFCAGSLSGVAQTMTTAPFDMVKVRMQNPGYTNMNPIQVARSILQSEGPAAFYKGISSMLMLVPVSNAFMFISYGTAQTWARAYNTRQSNFPANPSKLHAHQYFLCGSFAGFVSAFSYCPQELVKIRLQMQRHAVAGGAKPQYAGLFDCISQIVKLEGVRGLYRGFGATLVRDLPATGAWYGGYELARSYLSGGSDAPPIWANMMSGSFGGICYWLCGFPQDVAKSRIQTSPLPPAERPSASFQLILHLLNSNQNFDCLLVCFVCLNADPFSMMIQIARTEGVSRLFRGMSTCLVRAIPSSGVLFGSYQYLFDTFTAYSKARASTH